jgi:hypothetical protein
VPPIRSSQRQPRAPHGHESGVANAVPEGEGEWVMLSAVLCSVVPASCTIVSMLYDADVTM